MPKKNYQVFLTDDDIVVLNNIRKNGHSSAKTIMHANILLNTNDSFPEKKKSNRELSEIFGVSLPTINKIRKTYCEEGLAAALNRKTRLTPETMSKITGEFEAHVIATALSPPPKGYAKWNLRLLAEHCMEKKYIVSISHTAVGTILNTNQLKPHLSKYWCIPKENDPYYEPVWKIFLQFTRKNTTLPYLLSVWMKNLSGCLTRSVNGSARSLWKQILKQISGGLAPFKKLILNTSAWGQPAYLCLRSRSAAGGTLRRQNTGQWGILQK